MQSKYRLIAISVTLLLLVSIFGWAMAQSETPQAPDEMQGASFTYQGQLDRSGAPFTGACDFQFSLWDALSGGSRRGSIQTISSLSVNQGRFTALLNQGSEFGALPFNGDVRKFIESHDRLYVVEMNHIGQMHQILTIEYPDLATRLISLTHNNGLPLTARWLVEQVTGKEND